MCICLELCPAYIHTEGTGELWRASLSSKITAFTSWVSGLGCLTAQIVDAACMPLGYSQHSNHISTYRNEHLSTQSSEHKYFGSLKVWWSDLYISYCADTEDSYGSKDTLAACLPVDDHSETMGWDGISTTQTPPPPSECLGGTLGSLMLNRKMEKLILEDSQSVSHSSHLCISGTQSSAAHPEK